MLGSKVFLLICATMVNFVEASIGHRRKVRGDRILLNKRNLDDSLLPMYLRVARNRNNKERNQLNKRIGSLIRPNIRLVKSKAKANMGRLNDMRTTSNSLLPKKVLTNTRRVNRSKINDKPTTSLLPEKVLMNRKRADRSRLDTENILEMIPMSSGIYVGSLNETFPIPLYLKVATLLIQPPRTDIPISLKASTVVNSLFGVLGGGGLLAGGAALLGATGSSLTPIFFCQLWVRGEVFEGSN